MTHAHRQMALSRDAGVRRRLHAWLLYMVVSILIQAPAVCLAEPGIFSPDFDDRPLKDPVVHPPWFKLSFLELSDDLQDARGEGKAGIIVYFGQDNCPYCKEFMEVNFGKQDIVNYTRKYFDVIGIDIYGRRTVIDLEGNETTEKQYSIDNGTNFTPSFIFYDLDGHIALKLSGYHSPYKFRAALEYVARGHYRQESFRAYLARAPLSMAEGSTELNLEGFFQAPPHMLARKYARASRPLVVFFERRVCHSCDVLHEGALSNPLVQAKFWQLESVQLDIESETPVMTPSGELETARSWAEKLGIYYTPTLVVFDQSGEEMIRVDSVIHFYRLQNVLDYILSGGYKKYKNYQLWRAAKNLPE